MGAIENIFKEKINQEVENVLNAKHSHWLLCDLFVYDTDAENIYFEYEYKYYDGIWIKAALKGTIAIEIKMEGKE